MLNVERLSFLLHADLFKFGYIIVGGSEQDEIT